MAKPGISPELVREAFADSEAPALVLFALTCKLFPWILPQEGEEHQPVEPVEIWLAYQREFQLNTPVWAENKITALLTAVETDLFFEHLPVFRAIIGGMVHGDISDMVAGNWTELSAAEIGVALHDVTMVRGDECPPFTPPILDLIAQEIKEEAADPSDLQACLAAHNHSINHWLLRLGLVSASPATA